jgi:flagellar biosynthesis protein FliR
MALLLLSLRPLATFFAIGVALQLPALVTLGLTASISLLVVGLAAVDMSSFIGLSTTQQLLIAGRELVTGGALGLAAALPALAVHTSVTMVESSSSEFRTMRFRSLYALTVAMIFFAVNGPVLIAGQLVRSYGDIPIAGAEASSASVLKLLGLAGSALSQLFALALPMALPLMATALTVALAGSLAARVSALAYRRTAQSHSWPLLASVTPLILFVAIAALFATTARYITTLVVQTIR